MKAVRIVQVLVVVALLVYFVLLHAANPTLLNLPFFLPLPPALVVAMALGIGWLIGWLPGRLAAWRRAREVRRLQHRIEELERNASGYERTREPSTPVIPDRMPASDDASDTRGSG